MSSALFSPITLRGLTLANRIVVSPMCQYNADSGSANDWHLMHLGQLAMGAAGLVVVEATAVSAAARITHRCLGLYSDDNERALARVLAFCRAYGVTALGIQLAHAGRKGSVHTPLDGGAGLAPDEQPWTPVAPSALPYAPDRQLPQALDRPGLAEVKAQFAAAAERAARLGFELAELHAAHGYLLHEFLSPRSNRRSDEYGGSLDHRMRFSARGVRGGAPDLAGGPAPRHPRLGDRLGRRRLDSRRDRGLRPGAQGPRLRFRGRFERRPR
jgi:NADPH2 dehydrogenase